MDYAALAKQYGGTSAVDYAALAKQYGGTTETAKPSKAEAAANSKSAAYKEGLKISDGSLAGYIKSGLATALQGPLMGFADEIGGALGGAYDAATGPDSFGKSYAANRDAIRGMTDAYKDEHPYIATASQLAASAPMLVLNPLGKLAGAGITGAKTAMGIVTPAAAATTGFLGKAATAAATGAGYGVVQGTGDSTATTTSGLLGDAALSGVVSAATGGGLSGVGTAAGAVAKNIGQRVSKTQAYDFALQKVAEALNRDAKGTVATQTGPINQIAARLGKLGEDATLTDAAGRNTNQLLDTLATQPGRTKETVYNLLHDRQANVGNKMRDAADSALGVEGQRLPATIDALIAKRSADAGPLYDAVRPVNVQTSNELRSVLKIADDIGAMAQARKMAMIDEKPFTYDVGSKNVSIGDMDIVKQGIDAMIHSEKNAITGKLSPIGAKYQNLKSRLTNELDTVTTDSSTGVSAYKQARSAFEDPSKLIDAANAGKKSLGLDEAGITRSLKNLGDDETQAFRIGAFEALRGKLGTQSGQTEIMSMWKNQTTQEKLKAIFGDERSYREFAADVSKQAALKKLQSVGVGSQTAARLAGAEDLGSSAMKDAGAALASTKFGDPLGAFGSAKKFWNTVSVPQSVRDEMGNMLMKKGPKAQEQLNAMAGLIQRINAGNEAYSQGVGQIGSQIGSQLAQPITYK